DAFVINKVTRDQLLAEDSNSSEILKPYCRGKDIKRWHLINGELFIILALSKFDIAKYPAVQKHLEAHREKLEPKPEDWPSDREWPGRKPGTYKWYEIQDQTKYWREFERPKIISTKVSLRPTFTVDTSGAFLVNTSYLLLCD